MGAVLKACAGGKPKTDEPASKGAEGEAAKSIRPVVFSGPSGSGCSTLIKKLIEENPTIFGLCVSHTTRAAREGETDGKEYHFVSSDDMKKMIDGGEFIEHAKYAGNQYGTSKKALEDVMKHEVIAILDLELSGVQAMKKSHLKPIYIFIKPPSTDTLESRLQERGENEEAIKEKLEAANAEIEYAEIAGNFDHTIVNDDLEKAFGELKTALGPAMEEAKKHKEGK